MALAATIIWEVRNGGSDTNGGGFKFGATGTDWTLQDAAQYSVTDAVTAGTTTITSATANFGTDVVGNVLYIEGGTAPITAGWYEITSRTNSTTIVVDRSTGLTTGTGATLRIGGAMATPGQVAGIKVAGNDVFIKYNATPYTLTSDTQNVSGGKIVDTTGGADNNFSWWVGYDTMRTRLNMDVNRPTIKARSGSSTLTLMACSTNFTCAASIIFDGDGANTTAITGFSLTAIGQAYRLHAVNCEVYGLNLYAGQGYFCSATACSGTAAIYGGNLFCCESYSNTCHGFLFSANSTECSMICCLSYNNSGGSTDGFSLEAVSQSWHYYGCIAYNNGRDGFLVGNYPRSGQLANCIAYGNGREGYRSAMVVDSTIFINCAGGGNTSGNYTAANLPNVVSFVVLTADPFVDAANGNLSLNHLSGGGALLKSAGFPGALPRGLSIGFTDIGALQHFDGNVGNNRFNSGFN